MSESESKWSSGRKLVVVVLAAAVGIGAWVLITALTGSDSSCKGAKCSSYGVELGPDQWSLIEQQANSVTIRFEEGGGCHGFKKAQVDETKAEVKITMVVEFLVPPEGAACTDRLRSRAVAVELDRGLGGRELRVFRRELRVSR